MSNKLEPFETSDLPTGSTGALKAKRSAWVLSFSLALAAVLLYFALRGVDWASFWKIIIGGHYGFLLLMVPIASINYFIRAIRWSIFVRSNVPPGEKKIAILSVFWANMVGYMGNAFLPVRAGELLRSAFLGQKSGLGTSFVLATALTERALDAVVLVLIGSLSLLSLGNVSPAWAGAVQIMAIASLVLLAVILVAPHQQTLILRLLERLPLPVRWVQKIVQQVSRFLIGMRTLQNGRSLALFLLLTATIWFIDALGCMIGVSVISKALNLGQALIFLSALGLSSAIPSTPGYVGVYQFVAVTVLVPFGFSQPEALAYILINQVFGYIFSGCWGLLGLWQINRVKDSSRAIG